MKTSEEQSTNSPTRHKSKGKGGKANKVLNPNSDNDRSDTKINGINGCSDASSELNANVHDGGQHSQESANGIRLLCDAVDAIETSKCLKKCQHVNGLIVDNQYTNQSVNVQQNSYSGLSNSGPLPSTSCCCCQTSPSSSSSATTSCSTSSATLSCDTNKESAVQFIDDRDVNSLTDRVSTQLNISELNDKIDFVNYESERQMPDIMRLIQKDLSEPYSIYTYRYFIHNWPHLCFLVRPLLHCLQAFKILFCRPWTALNAWALLSAN